ncbi:hypothetical protein [Filimonas effusa]|uniref:Uncharacterized protein n=1 Tax=Filimonas effusa TaxID=2508721 RepID=A0A4Q1DE01_9BACT|nr:hypothetical protein [Filimonas effusa]RXK86913.1 hypothetical protein ESB13_09025 [Filimonas effusa]
MKLLPSVISGLAGSVALTLLHQCFIKKTKDAPRMDELGMDALSQTIDAWDIPAPEEETLYKTTLAGDIAGNAAYYALAGLQPKHSCLAGSLLGVAAGSSAIMLPGKLGLNPDYSNATPKTKALTLLLYITGGLVAGSVYKLIDRK